MPFVGKCHNIQMSFFTFLIFAKTRSVVMSDTHKYTHTCVHTHTLTRVKEYSTVKLYIAPLKSAPEGDGVFSGACWR